jgi:hypothetical protein
MDTKVLVPLEVNILRVAGVSGVVTKVGEVVLNQRDASHNGVSSHCPKLCNVEQLRKVPNQSCGLYPA